MTTPNTEDLQTPAEAPAPDAAKPASKKASKPAPKPVSDEDQLYEITLHDSDEIPPNGQFIGVNDKQYVLKPGIRTAVPRGVLDVLDNAVQSVPERDDTFRVIGWKTAPRLTYTLHRS